MEDFDCLRIPCHYQPYADGLNMGYLVAVKGKDTAILVHPRQIEEFEMSFKENKNNPWKLGSLVTRVAYENDEDVVGVVTDLFSRQEASFIISQNQIN